MNWRDKKGMKLSNAYTKMKRRCYEPTDNSYHNYGARGIIVCEEWRNSPKAFIEWALNNGFDMNLSLDRIDVNGNYEPNNCRWATRKEQALNKRNNIILEYKGIKKPLNIWAEEYGLNRYTLLNRLNRGWNVEKALTHPIDAKRRNHTTKKLSIGVINYVDTQ